MIKIYIQNYFMENMFQKKKKKKKLIITNRWNYTNNRKIKRIRQCIIIEKKWLALIDKTENKLESRKNKIKDYLSSIASQIPLQSYKCTKKKKKKVKEQSLYQITIV